MRFNLSPPVELRTLHRITPAENFQWFLDSKSWTIVEQLCMTTVLYRCWPVHADASSADSNRVFRCAVQPSQHPAISPGASLSDAGYSGGTDSPGLRERHSNWNPASPCRHLQSVLNAAARSVADLRRSDHINQTLTSLHYLCASERIQFKLAMLIFKLLHGLTPQYLVDDLSRV